MEQLWFLAAILVCPLVMGVVMVWMMRGMRADGRDRPGGREEPVE